MLTILSASAMMCFAVGFSLLANYFSSDNPNTDFLWSAIILLICALGSFAGALSKAKSEEIKREKQMDTLINELKGLRSDFKNRH